MMVGALALPFGAAPAYADGHTEPTPEIADKDWYNVVYYRFHEGKMGEAIELVEAFAKVDEALGSEPFGLVMSSGEWDMVVAFKMEGGIAEMGWQNNPAADAWNAEFERQLGSKEAVAQHWQKFYSIVKDRQFEIGYVPQ
ncbi:MAG: hypothetical protein AAF559_12290 [Pseudomonadota bacterium]